MVLAKFGNLLAIPKYTELDLSLSSIYSQGF